MKNIQSQNIIKIKGLQTKRNSYNHTKIEVKYNMKDKKRHQNKNTSYKKEKRKKKKTTVVEEDGTEITKSEGSYFAETQVLQNDDLAPLNRHGSLQRECAHQH